MLLPLWELQDRIGLDRVDEIVLLVGLLAAAAFLLLPRRYALALPVAVLLYFAIAFPAIQLGTAERARAGLDRRALPGDLGRAPRLDRSRRPGRGRGRSRLDRADRPLHRQPERVLLEERRPDLRHRPGRPRLAARDARRGRSRDGPLRSAGARALRRRRRLDRAGRAGARARRGLGAGALEARRRRVDLDDVGARALPERHLVGAARSAGGGCAATAASCASRSPATRACSRAIRS